MGLAWTPCSRDSHRAESAASAGPPAPAGKSAPATAVTRAVWIHPPGTSTGHTPPGSAPGRRRWPGPSPSSPCSPDLRPKAVSLLTRLGRSAFLLIVWRRQFLYVQFPNNPQLPYCPLAAQGFRPLIKIISPSPCESLVPYR